MTGSTLYRQKIDPADSMQSFLSIPLKLHCCRYWIMQEWECSDMAFPFWRIYHNITEGAFVRYKENLTHLTTDKFIVIPPNVPYSNGFRNPSCNILKEGITGEKITAPVDPAIVRRHGMFDHLFIHFNLGMPYDNVRPDIYVVPVSPALQSLTDSIRNHCMMNTSLFEFSSSLLIHSLVLQLLTGLPKNIWPGSDIDPRILKVIAYIDRNRDKKILNGTLAAMVNMATNSFARFFSQQTGDTVQVFLMKHRIEQARLMLHHGNENIDSIALECGFCDRHHFSKVFKSFTGVSPAYYKKNHTVEND